MELFCVYFHPVQYSKHSTNTPFTLLQAQGEDELGLSKGDVIEVLSKDYKISGDEGWWTGKCNGKVTPPNPNLSANILIGK